MSATTFRNMAAILVAGALVVGACNNDPGIMQAGGGGKGGTGKEPTPPGGGGNGGSTSGNKGGNGVPTPPGTGGSTGAGGTGAGGDKTCTAVGAMAKQLPVDIYVVLDRSGSMLNDINDDGMMGTMPTPTPGVPIKWTATVEALTKFVTAPGASGLQIGLGVFPKDNQMCRREECCQAGRYTAPVVPVTALPGGAMAFVDALAVPANAARMGNGTPTLPALQGAIQYAQQRVMTDNRRLAIALATDGMPNDCQSNVQNVSNAAMMGANMGIYTFVIGVGKRLDNLNQIAVAGGTKAAHLVEMATADELVKAFTDVQNQAAKLACSYMIPPPPAGMTLDPNKVNVRFNAPDPAMSFQVGQVMNGQACGPDGGWFYDNPSNPKIVNLCEASCAKVNSGTGGAIELLFGCAGIIIK